MTLDRFAELKPELCDRDLYIVQPGLDLRWHGLQQHNTGCRNSGERWVQQPYDGVRVSVAAYAGKDSIDSVGECS